MPVSKTQELLSNDPQDVLGWIQLGPAIEPSKNFVNNKIGDKGLLHTQSSGQFFLYKQLSEPNAWYCFTNSLLQPAGFGLHPHWCRKENLVHMVSLCKIQSATLTTERKMILLHVPERCLTPTKHCVYNKKVRHGVFQFHLLPFHLELGLLQAVELQFPTAKIQGCFYHYSQSIWRKVQKLGLQTTYQDDPTFKAFVSKMVALSFCPQRFLQVAWMGLKAEAPEPSHRRTILKTSDSMGPILLAFGTTTKLMVPAQTTM